MSTLEAELRSSIREIPDFPEPGINFKDFTPLLSDPSLRGRIVNDFAERYDGNRPDMMMSIESRGFLFGMLLADRFDIPLMIARKQGKLPPPTISQHYSLEYGQATVLETGDGAIPAGANVMIHDDLLATGGTAGAAAELVRQLGAAVHSFTFIAELDFLNGRDKLSGYSDDVYSLVGYST